MKSLKFHIAASTTENLFVTILCWYLIGSMSILGFLLLLESLIK